MLDITNLTKEQLTQPAGFAAIKKEADDLIYHLMAPEANILASQLEEKIKSLPELKTELKDIYHQYVIVIIQLKLTAIPCLDDNSVLNLIKYYYLYSFNAGLDLNERMTGKMYSIPDLVWPNFAQKLINALKENNQKIGSQQIIIKGDTQPSLPTIQNWLTDYDRNFGPEKHSALEQQQYLNQNPNIKFLTQPEKNILKETLQFYDNLKPISASLINRYLSSLELGSLPAEIAAEAEKTAILPGAPTATIPPGPSATPQPENIPSQQTPPTAPVAAPRADTYREPISSEDTSGPQKMPTRPVPRIEGNIIDLKDFGEK